MIHCERCDCPFEPADDEEDLTVCPACGFEMEIPADEQMNQIQKIHPEFFTPEL